jgi:hypothetical protein
LTRNLEKAMKHHVIAVAHALIIATAAVSGAYADQAISPGHPRWYGQGAGPVGADLITWVGQHATKAPAGQPDPAYYGIAGGPVGADLIAKLARVERRHVALERVNIYDRGAPSAEQLAARGLPRQRTLAAGSAPEVR